VALGACLIEKHLTLSRTDGGPDAAFSLDPSEFKSLVEAVRVTEKSLGQAQFGVTPHERKTVPFRRSLFAVADIQEGELFTSENVRSIRPANGLHPRYLPEVLGRRASRHLARGTPLSWDMVEREMSAVKTSSTSVW